LTLKNIDISGQAADYAWVAGVCEQFGVLMIGDAAESLGARHDLGMAGSFGDVLLASFNGNKIMTTSGGGMLLTDNGEHAQRVRYRALAASADGIELVEDVPWG
jgi:dTDP-4-amino-4,6-dideoxygalactose transaminase